MCSGAPAQRINATSNARSYSAASCSTRDSTTRALVSANSRITVERKEARRRIASTITISRDGRTTAIGIPGMPAPDPISTMRRPSVGMSSRKRRLSIRTFSMSQGWLVEPTSRWTFCHLLSNFRYLSMLLASGSVSPRRSPGSGPFGSPEITSRRRSWRRRDRGHRRQPPRRAAPRRSRAIHGGQ